MLPEEFVRLEGAAGAVDWSEVGTTAQKYVPLRKGNDSDASEKKQTYTKGFAEEREIATNLLKKCTRTSPSPPSPAPPLTNLTSRH
ncbi:hypothetical protein NDU88_007772 [Pleurodeles waltl]|uniref:Uncharacterized protein n=1 Tax=Pleurodeles waltl TaxID=8319 RepID=A0AAV7VTB2_PLEWA|nr:hypothetical protein NDU88_007772 [Pleurodeles waltl]